MNRQTAERRNGWIAALVVAVAAAIFFGRGLADEPYFVDESAHVRQTYYFRLLSSGQLHHPDWLHPAAYDHPPLYKYVLGAWLSLWGYPPPSSVQEMERWYGGNWDPPPPEQLRAARWCMLLTAVFGCVAMFALGRLLVGTKTGLMAAALLAASPLYALHARRAMGDDFTQGLILAAFAGVLFAASGFCPRPIRWGRLAGGVLIAGLSAGLAAACKLNGATAAATIAFWVTVSSGALAIRAVQDPAVDRAVLRTATLFLLVAILSTSLALGVFVLINPYFYAQPANIASPESDPATVAGDNPSATPSLKQQTRELAELGVVGRAQRMLDYRVQALRDADKQFPDDALPGLGSRLVAVVADGMGRWFAFGAGKSPPTDESIDAYGLLHCLIVLGLVLHGAWYALWDGRQQVRELQIPTAWLLIAWPAIDLLSLLPNLTLRWDRYFLSVVVWSSILAVYGIAAGWRHLVSRLVLTPSVKVPSE